MSTYFKIDDLRDGWAVTWPGFEQRFCNTEDKIKNLLAVLFDDIGLWEAQLGVQPWHSVLDPAKANCASYTTNDAVQIRGEYYYRFYFANDQDRVWFALRWA